MKGLRRRLFPAPVSARHAEYSMVFSEDDAPSRPSPRLLDIALGAISCARQTDLQDVSRRLENRFRYPDEAINLWPGEHYRLLAALVETLQPKLVIEIGSAEGISALSMRKYLPPGGKILTFDIVPWPDYPRTCLKESDFDDGRLTQIVCNLGEPDSFARHRDLLGRADLVFIDAAKDGELEYRLLSHFDSLSYVTRPLFVFDDIRLWNMLRFWRDLKWPKLDLTSFGHWCGTGLCEPG
jgi:hypothetical protein